MKCDKPSFLFFSFLILGSVFLIFLAFGRAAKNQETIVPSVTLLKEDGLSYKQEVENIFNRYLTERGRFELNHSLEVKTQWLNLVAKTRQDMLSLKTKAEFQTKHLQLILQLDKMRDELAEEKWAETQNEEVELFALFNKI